MYNPLFSLLQLIAASIIYPIPNCKVREAHPCRGSGGVSPETILYVAKNDE